ncbi:MAG TPA: DUF2182 domain-containing protein [Rhizomicrobium sp.]|nr:DUF2182 domain-containing protein [Rhizomicrobium sp.]
MVLRRDRSVVLASLLVLALLSWSYLFWFSGNMALLHADGGMAVAGMAPDFQDWSALHFLTMFLMWAVMMVGMMTPSVAPMILLYAQVARSAPRERKVFAPAAWFVAGYLLAWSLFALIATTGQWALEGLALLNPNLASKSGIFGGLLLIAAGIYQWTPFKQACLAQCRSPLLFIQQNGGFQARGPASLGLGLLHGTFCIGCCWALMALLFVGGVMNFAWVALLMVLVLLEKIVPRGVVLARGAGLLMILAGGAMLAMRQLPFHWPAPG